MSYFFSHSFVFTAPFLLCMVAGPYGSKNPWPLFLTGSCQATVLQSVSLCSVWFSFSWSVLSPCMECVCGWLHSAAEAHLVSINSNHLLHKRLVKSPLLWQIILSCSVVLLRVLILQRFCFCALLLVFFGYSCCFTCKLSRVGGEDTSGIGRGKTALDRRSPTVLT